MRKRRIPRTPPRAPIPPDRTPAPPSTDTGSEIVAAENVETVEKSGIPQGEIRISFPFRQQKRLTKEESCTIIMLDNWGGGDFSGTLPPGKYGINPARAVFCGILCRIAAKNCGSTLCIPGFFNEKPVPKAQRVPQTDLFRISQRACESGSAAGRRRWNPAGAAVLFFFDGEMSKKAEKEEAPQLDGRGLPKHGDL